MAIQCTLPAIPKVAKKLSIGMKDYYTIIGKVCGFYACIIVFSYGKYALIDPGIKKTLVEMLVKSESSV